ncbi:MAG: GatB/YqeY domain-containing protein, partial [Rubrobacteridae bacterium]|nr:GatB/YqeY domain-containing protein [Rubrobacteridae bacterium]
MSLKERIIEDLKEAMRAVDDPDYKIRLSAIRMLKADIMNTEIARKGELSDDEVTALIQKQIKTRNESIEQY